MSVAIAAPRGHLLRILGVAFGVAVTLGNMIGSGILRSPSTIAATIGSAVLILAIWLAGALHAALAANVLVELGTAVPQAGGPYVFSRRALGDVPGLIVGWSIWCAKLAGVASGAVSFANFLAILVPALTERQSAVAISLLVALFGANILGLRQGRAIQEATSFLKGALLLAFVAAAYLVIPSQHDALTPSPVHALTWIAIIAAYKLVRGAYSGWDASIYFAEESHAPAQSLPRALFMGLALTSLLYVGVNAALLHALGVGEIARTTLPFMTVLKTVAGPAASFLFAVGAMIAVLSVANANIMTAPRILLALARDRLLPVRLGDVNAGGSPHTALLMTAVGSIALAATGKFQLIFGLIGTLDTVAAFLTVAAFFALRRLEPALPRPFRALGYPALPLLALVVEAVLLVLFNVFDREGFIAAAILCVACVPFAWIARRAQLDNA